MRSWLGIAAAAIFMGIASVACGEDSPLKIEIKVSQEAVHNKQVFHVDSAVRNTSTEEQVIETTQCTYGHWNWKADSPFVGVQEHEIPCKKNPIVYVKLKPGEAYERALSVRIFIPARKVTMQSVTFRLGCAPPLGYNLHTEPPPYIWSAPATVKIRE